MFTHVPVVRLMDLWLHAIYTRTQRRNTHTRTLTHTHTTESYGPVVVNTQRATKQKILHGSREHMLRILNQEWPPGSNEWRSVETGSFCEDKRVRFTHSDIRRQRKRREKPGIIKRQCAPPLFQPASLSLHT